MKWEMGNFGLCPRGARGYVARMEHSAGFLKIVNEVRPRVEEISLAEARERLAKNPGTVLVDVREDSEWNAGHAVKAVHLGRGVLERDIERIFPDPATELILYCGGGFRSALAADVAQRMGYSRVFSLAGGFRAMTVANWATEKGS
jgi:rhodanese-related sulfurtransferase